MKEFGTFRRRKILFIVYSRNSLGYVIPAIALAKKLQLRGHDVVFSCSNEVKGIPMSHGIRHVPVREKPPMPPWSEIDIERSYREITLQGLGNSDYLRDTLEDEIKVIEAEQPDLVIHNFRFTAGIAAKQCKVRCVSILNMNIAIHYPDLLPIIIESLTQNGASRDDICSIFGDLVLVPDYSFLSPLKSIDPMVSDILVRNSIEIKYCGPWLKENPFKLPPKPELKRNLVTNSSLPLVFITLGGSNNALDTLAKIFKFISNEVNLIVVTGPNVKIGLFEEAVREIRDRYTNAEVTVEQFTDQSISYMKAADLAIIHGGYSTTMEALMCGTPIIGIPNNPEQYGNLAKVVKYGMGILAESSMDWPKLPKLIEEGVSSQFAVRAAAVSNYFKDIYTPEIIPKYLETYMEMTD